MDALSKDEMVLVKSFFSKENKYFWLCAYIMALNKHRIPFMLV